MATDRAELIKIIEAKYPKMNLRTTEEFDGHTDGIWVAGTEDGLTAKDGRVLFDYYVLDHNKVRYFNGIHKEIRTILEKHGWYGQWHDAGTIMFWES